MKKTTPEKKKSTLNETLISYLTFHANAMQQRNQQT